MTTVLSIAWSTLKSLKADIGLRFLYISFALGTDPETYRYDVFASSPDMLYKSSISGADATDFETNYQSASTSIPSENDGIALAETRVNLTGSITTEGTSKESIISYTVPANTYFKVLSYSIARISPISTGAEPAALEVEDVIKDQNKIDSLTNAPGWTVSLPKEWDLASGGQVVTLTVTPSGGLETTWAATLHGVLR